MTSANRPIRIVLVEDNAADALLTTEALDEAAVETAVVVQSDAEAALAWLRTEGADLVILDLNLPGMTGLELLETLKDEEDLRSIPVIVLSSSRSHGDILGSYDRQASSYISKPIGFDDFSEIMRSIEQFWLGTVQLPPR